MKIQGISLYFSLVWRNTLFLFLISYTNVQQCALINETQCDISTQKYNISHQILPLHHPSSPASVNHCSAFRLTSPRHEKSHLPLCVWLVLLNINSRIPSILLQIMGFHSSFLTHLCWWTPRFPLCLTHCEEWRGTMDFWIRWWITSCLCVTWWKSWGKNTHWP